MPLFRPYLNYGDESNELDTSIIKRRRKSSISACPSTNLQETLRKNSSDSLTQMPAIFSSKMEVKSDSESNHFNANPTLSDRKRCSLDNVVFAVDALHSMPLVQPLPNKFSAQYTAASQEYFFPPNLPSGRRRSTTSLMPDSKQQSSSQTLPQKMSSFIPSSKLTKNEPNANTASTLLANNPSNGSKPSSRTRTRTLTQLNTRQSITSCCLTNFLSLNSKENNFAVSPCSNSSDSFFSNKPWNKTRNTNPKIYIPSVN